MSRGEEGKASSTESSCIRNEPKGETAEITLCEFLTVTSQIQIQETGVQFKLALCSTYYGLCGPCN